MDASLQACTEQLVKEIAGEAQTAEDLHGLMMKSALERMLDTEMDVHLGRKTSANSEGKPAHEESSEQVQAGKKNRRNWRGRKTARTETGDVTISTPRDRNGTFRPQLIGKHQRRVPGFDEKILALYAKGMTTRVIQEIVQELYDVEVSATLISEITEDVDHAHP